MIFLEKLFLNKNRHSDINLKWKQNIYNNFCKIFTIQKADVQYKRGSLESDTNINSMLFAGKLMVSVALPHEDLYYKNFLEEDKEWGIFGCYEKLPWIKINRNIFVYSKRIN